MKKMSDMRSNHTNFFRKVVGLRLSSAEVPKFLNWNRNGIVGQSLRGCVAPGAQSNVLATRLETADLTGFDFVFIILLGFC